VIFADLNLDEEIATIELRINQRKRLIATDVDQVTVALRNGVTSRTALLVAAGIGFALGRITDGKAAPAGRARAGRLLSIVEGVRVALKLIRTPALVWAARLFDARHSAGGASKQPVRERAMP
jgi:hypothetical protein